MRARTLLLSVVLSVVAVFAFAAPALADTEGDYTFSISGGNATITEYTGPGGHVVVPATLGGAPVVAIGEHAFNMPPDPEFPFPMPDDTLLSVTIPEGVTTLGDSVFRECQALVEVTLPDTVTSLPWGLFEACSALKTVNNIDQVTEMEPYAFAGSGLESFTIPSGVTEIASRVFTGCGELTSVVIPEGVTSIDTGAFEEADIRSVTLPSTLTSMGWAVFQGNPNLRAARFLGDAPTLTGAPGSNSGAIFYNSAAGFTVYYYEGAAGFPTPPGPWVAAMPDMFGRTASYQTAYIRPVVSSSVGTHGSATWSGDKSFPFGSSPTICFHADEGWRVGDVVVDGESQGAVWSYCFTDLQEDHVVEVTFERRAYAITAGAGANGSITPSGASSVDYGTNATYAITPAAGYHIASVLVDGVLVGAPKSYTFANVTAPHTISAAFAWTKLRTTTSIRVNKMTIKSGGYVTLSGKLNGGTFASGTRLVLKAKKPGSTKWVVVKSRNVSTIGSASYHCQVSRRGSWHFRVEFAGNAVYLAAPRSAGARLTVR